MFQRVVTFFCIVLCAHYSIITALPHNTRIVGGNSAAVGQFPYQVSLQEKNGAHICGGAILNDRFILTAAHCVVVGSGISTFPPHFYQVRVGSIQRTTGGSLVHLKNIIVNKSFGNLLNDIALLELEKPLVWSTYIRPIDLADSEVPSGADVTVSGWGQMFPDDPHPQRLQWSTLKAINSEECKARIGWSYESLICLDHVEDEGICNGDAGSPAVYQGKLVGLASFHIGGCGNANPDGFTKISHYLVWIWENS